MTASFKPRCGHLRWARLLLTHFHQVCTDSVDQHFSFSDLGSADLVVDAVYEGGNKGNAGDDPISRLAGVGNQGGFRYIGSIKPFAVKLCVLYSELSDPDWPDALHIETGRFVYYGDNKTPGHSLHGSTDTGAAGKKGNRILQEVFDRLHSNKREEIPPFLVFTKGAKGRDVVFRGLAVPGAPDLSPTEDLIAVWKSKNGRRFQNYVATFTILDVPCVSRVWLNDIQNWNNPFSKAPPEWIAWRLTGSAKPLTAIATLQYRKPVEQIPTDALRQSLLRQIVAYYDQHPDWKWGFERCAAALVKMMDRNIVSLDLTRYWRDGGRDAVGSYRIGTGSTFIHVDFALEAKCKGERSGSGVRETARLIARIRHRQFGIFITTSYVAEQAYQEIIEDGHPVLIIAGIDIADLLISHGINTPNALQTWLESIG